MIRFAIYLVGKYVAQKQEEKRLLADFQLGLSQSGTGCFYQRYIFMVLLRGIALCDRVVSE